jgi:hypothetical protein
MVKLLIITLSYIVYSPVNTCKMFKISNTQKAILDILGEKYEILINCSSGQSLNTIDGDLARRLDLGSITPRLMKFDDEVIPISNVEFTIEITSLDGEVKRVAGVADVTIHLRKDKDAIKIGSKFLKEIEACIIM